MSNRPADRSRPGDRGAVLVIVMLVMLALLGLGITGLWLTSGNLQISSSVNMRNQALYAAEAGIEAIRADLNGPVSRSMAQLLAGGKGGNYDNVPTGVFANGQPNGIGAVYHYADGTAVRDVPYPPASFGRGAGSTVEAPVSATMGTYTVWIRNDTGELRQGSTTNDINGVVVVRARGLAVDGSSEVVLEVTLGPGPTNRTTPELCYAGKNACDDNSSTLGGVFIR